MEKILTEWRKYLTEVNTIEYSNTMSNLIAWLDAGGKVPDSITNADEKQKQAMEWAKVLFADSKKYGYLKRDKRLVPTIQGLTKASKTVAGKEADEVLAVRRDDHPISNMFADISRSVHKKTGIRILDPTAKKNPPAWAAKDPALWATLQTVADFLVSDPFSAAIMFVPFGKLGGAGVKALEQAGVKGAAKMAAMPIGQALVKVAPEKVAKILQTLETTEVKAVVVDFHKNLAAQRVPPQKLVVNYGGMSWVDDYVAATRKTIAKAISGELSNYARIVIDSVKLGKVIVKVDPGGHGVRHIVVLESKQGPVIFYRSTGTSGGKELGEWTIFKGFAPHSKTGGVHYAKDAYSVNLTKGGDEYLTKLSLALEHAWSSGLFRTLTSRGYAGAARSQLRTVNKGISDLNKLAGYQKYMFYSEELLEAAYINRFLRNQGATGPGTVSSTFLPWKDNIKIGLNDIASESITARASIKVDSATGAITKSKKLSPEISDKILPSLNAVLGK